MKVFIDTSVMVNAFYTDFPHYKPSAELLDSYKQYEMFCASHTLAEVYSSLTRMPGRHRTGKEEAFLYVKNLHDRLQTITLDEQEHFNAIQMACEHGITGGAIYDALIAHCALKAHAKIIYTWNIKHFTRLGPAIAPRLQTP